MLLQRTHKGFARGYFPRVAFGALWSTLEEKHSSLKPVGCSQ